MNEAKIVTVITANQPPHNIPGQLPVAVTQYYLARNFSNSLLLVEPIQALFKPMA